MAAVNCIHCQSLMPQGSRFCPTCGADTEDPGSSPRVSLGSSADLMIRLQASTKGHYEVKELLGRGGMGAVFLATDLSLDRPVAIKVLPPDLSEDKKFYQRFEHEARTAAKLDHPHIIPIYAVESSDEINYFVMKYVTGRTLDQLLQSGPLPVDLAQRILWESACALGHAHQRGVVHRDVKPANIMIDDHGRAMVTDFGISKALESAHGFTTTGQVIGTPHYMSPEQAKGIPVDGRTDQYSLGVVAYRMLAGRLPFMDDSVHTVIYKHIFEMPPPLAMFRPDAPEFVREAIARALVKDIDDRFATMEEFATAVWPEHPVRSYSVSGGSFPRTSLDAATEITSPSPQEPKRRGLKVAAVLGTLLVVAGGGVAGATLLLDDPLNLLRGTEGPNTQPTQTAMIDTPDSTLGGSAIDTVDSATVAMSDTANTMAAQPVTEPASSPPPRQEPARPVQRPVSSPAQTPSPPATPRIGFLTVGVTENGEQSFATVFVDGVEIGDTPVFQHELPIGSHEVTIRREGYVPITATVVVNPGSTTTLRRALIRESQQ